MIHLFYYKAAAYSHMLTVDDLTRAVFVAIEAHRCEHRYQDSTAASPASVGSSHKPRVGHDTPHPLNPSLRRCTVDQLACFPY